MPKYRRPAPAPTPGRGPLIVMIGGGVLLAAALAFALWPRGNDTAGQNTAPRAGAARLQVDRELIDLGDVKLGQWVQADFTLTNTGGQPLHFTETPYVELVEGC